VKLSFGGSFKQIETLEIIEFSSLLEKDQFYPPAMQPFLSMLLISQEMFPHPHHNPLIVSRRNL
jgi:hypothetical protein